MLEALAVRDPARALHCAQSETNRVLRCQLLQSVLRGWATVDPLGAGHWALSANPDFREAALTAVFSGAVAANPDAAVRAGRALLVDPASAAAGCGNKLVAALCTSGQFETAARLVATIDAVPDRNGLAGETYARWALFQPDRASTAALAIADPAERVSALRGVVGGWSEADPAAAVDFTTALPDDEATKSALLGQSLLRWSKTDAKAASHWINTHELGAAMDQGVAAVATQDYMKPDVAISWAESVVNPALCSETLTTVLRRWATSDVAAVQRYLDSTSALTPDDRQEVEQLIATLNGAPIAAHGQP